MFSLIIIHRVLIKLIPGKYALSGLRFQINFKASIMILTIINLLEWQFISRKEVITVHISDLLFCLPQNLSFIRDFRLQVLNFLHSLNFRLFPYQLFFKVPIPSLLILRCYFSHRFRVLKCVDQGIISADTLGI